MLASLLFPYDDDVPGLIEDWLWELQSETCIIQYEAEGQHYIQITNWLQHQRIDHPSKSFIPEISESSRILANPREHSSEDLGSRTKEGTKDLGPIAPSAVAEVEPKTKAVAKVKPEPDPLYTAIFQSFIGKTGAFTNYPKEAQAIKRIIKYCEQHAPRYTEGDKIKLAELAITKYFELTQNGDRFWRGQPFTPSNLSAPGIFDRVLVEIVQGNQEDYSRDIPF